MVSHTVCINMQAIISWGCWEQWWCTEEEEEEEADFCLFCLSVSLNENKDYLSGLRRLLHHQSPRSLEITFLTCFKGLRVLNCKRDSVNVQFKKKKNPPEQTEITDIEPLCIIKQPLTKNQGNHPLLIQKSLCLQSAVLKPELYFNTAIVEQYMIFATSYVNVTILSGLCEDVNSGHTKTELGPSVTAVRLSPSRNTCKMFLADFCLEGRNVQAAKRV